MLSHNLSPAKRALIRRQIRVRLNRDREDKAMAETLDESDPADDARSLIADVAAREWADTCVCGGSRARPNPDCERCGLLAERNRLAAELAECREECSMANGYFDRLLQVNVEVKSDRDRLRSVLRTIADLKADDRDDRDPYLQLAIKCKRAARDALTSGTIVAGFNVRAKPDGGADHAD